MADMTESLWPGDLYIPNKQAPVTILREQAALLGRQTQNLVEGEVSSRGGENGRIVHIFEAHAMALGGYIYPLLYVSHMISLYPASIHKSLTAAQIGANPIAICQNPEDFKAKLREVFHSEEVRGVISSMLAQSE